jgi:molybdopterin-guanine dinucleotide biosynthesis protein A
MYNNISGVILAGGDSKRFGGVFKAGIVIDGKTILSRMLDIMVDIFDEIIIVTNTPEELKHYSDRKIIRDVFPAIGPLGGIHSAMKVSKKEALFVFAGDMPLINREIIISQIEFFNKNICEILIPRVNTCSEPLHGIYGRSLLPMLEGYIRINNNYAIRKFIKMRDVTFMQFEDSEISRNAFTNINSPSDLTTLKIL